MLFAPVYSNLPAPDPAASGRRDGRTVGLFGYSYQGAAVSLVLDAIAQLRAGGTDVRLRLLGAPGPDSAQGGRWRELARERGIEEALSFSGALPAQELSDELAACEVLLFADAAGPSSRKTTLAASVASGRPVRGARRADGLARPDRLGSDPCRGAHRARPRRGAGRAA